jgi:hypothetical protein
MTDTDENLLTAAKLREQIDGRLDSNTDFHPHTGIVADDGHRSSLSFVESVLRDSDDNTSFAETDLGDAVLSKFRSDRATTAVSEGNGSVLSHLVGVTEQDLDASALTLPVRILEELERDGALTTVLAAGDPNTGKTNTAWLLVELARSLWSDLRVISNARAGIVDNRVTTCHDLGVTLLEHRAQPKAVLIDEGSTHFDARTNSHEVATQWSPLLKRMSKLGVEVVIVIGHTGKDVDPEMKRLTSLAFYKSEPEIVEFYETWPSDSDRPTDQLFDGSLESLEATAVEYDPDEPAPWEWNLRADLFDKDLDWSNLLAALRERGPAE